MQDICIETLKIYLSNIQQLSKDYTATLYEGDDYKILIKR